MSSNRVLRIVIGAVAIGYGMYSGNAWFYLGILPLLTGVINWCPLEMKMGTCDPASGCCASPLVKSETACCSTEESSDSCCSVPVQKTALWSSGKPADSCCTEDDACYSSSNEDNMLIEILGTGCKSCTKLKAVVDGVVADMDDSIVVKKVEDLDKIMAYRIMRTPGFVINGKVLSSGRVLSENEITAFIKAA